MAGRQPGPGSLQGRRGNRSGSQPVHSDHHPHRAGAEEGRGPRGQRARSVHPAAWPGWLRRGLGRSLGWARKLHQGSRQGRVAQQPVAVVVGRCHHVVGQDHDRSRRHGQWGREGATRGEDHRCGGDCQQPNPTELVHGTLPGVGIRLQITSSATGSPSVRATSKASSPGFTSNQPAGTRSGSWVSQET